ncbi:hypothetical protein D9611_004256 [Ephemerocybe angulata]|uniref:Uncharacterized protein n=2 Tax=Ephemerocybe angulata TaxID=980116 RepID=A0A8H6IFN6_9AGAR|nr:hypothetical protein D9611_004256 [Tulosesus angulatus]KAF6764755.1 hypothetical protein DFP72DRAFT_1058577 [Tulosesus angulatus]
MPALLQPQPIYAAHPAGIHRLRSPIHLVPTCSSPSRRRTRPAPRRRRPQIRAERGPHAFDQLPWLSALEAAPEHTSPWDIADLSLLPAESEDGPGPVRRRKTSLRSNPMAAPCSPQSLPLPPSPSPAPLSPLDTNSQFLFPCAPSPSPSPATPLARFNPSRILFRNLMPVSHCDDGSPHQCINIRPTSLDPF